MNFCRKNLLLLAALLLSVAGASQESVATDRFDVRVEVLEFYSYRETNPVGFAVEYRYNFDAIVEDVGRRHFDSLIIARPRYPMQVGRSVRFDDIKKPKHKNRQIGMSAKVVGHYSLVDGTHKIQNLGRATGETSSDLFRDADRSKDDQAVQILTIRNNDFRMKVRVTVIEVD